MDRLVHFLCNSCLMVKYPGIFNYWVCVVSCVCLTSRIDLSRVHNQERTGTWLGPPSSGRSGNIPRCRQYIVWPPLGTGTTVFKYMPNICWDSFKSIFHLKINSPISQFFPLKEGWHQQMYELTPSWHWAPFWHGGGSHWSPSAPNTHYHWL